MKIIAFLITILISTIGIFGQPKMMPASEILKEIKAGKTILVENVTVIGELDLTDLPNQINDAIYPEKGKTAKVFSNKITNAVTFKNVIFADNLKLFRKETNAKEIFEYRVVFEKSAKFENCIFEKAVNFELTNFDQDVSFANSTFKQRPLLVRMGIEKLPNLIGTVFEQKALYKFTQNSPEKILSAEEFKMLLQNLNKK